MSAIIALPLAADDVTLRRGDVTLDSAVDVSDAIAEIGYLFLGSTLASCDPVADVNADRNVDVSDPLFLLTHLFSHGPSPRPLDAVELEACGLVSVELAILAKPQEELSPIEIPLADGTGFVGEGVGLVEGEGTIEVTVPDGVSILQVLLYWNGFSAENDAADPEGLGDSTALVNGTEEVTGTLIGGPTRFFANALSTTYRADITDLGLITNGLNSITVETDYTTASNGASILVVIDDGSDSVIALNDGQDLAYFDFNPPLDTTVPQTFNFSPSDEPRTASLTMIAGSVEGIVSGQGDFRPNVIRVEVGGVVTEFLHEFGSTDGEEWDHVDLVVDIPANATSLTVQVLSADPENTGARPASLAWIVSGLSITPQEVPPEPASIGDTVYCDANNNGVQDDGELGIEGVTVNLRCAGDDEMLDTDDDLLDSQATDSSGNYLFTDLPAGECRVSVAVDTVPGPCNVTGVCETTVTEVLDAGEEFLDADFCFTEEPPPPGGEGCTPGYWKQKQHFGSWPDDISPDTLFADVFGSDAFGDKTLLEVLKQGGGGLKALGRHAVAAYLNARTISYAISADDIIAAVVDAIASGDKDTIEDLKNTLDDFNNDGCPLGRDPGDA